MIAGIPVSEVIAKYGGEGKDHYQIMDMLCGYSIHFASIVPSVILPINTAYMVTVPSLNIKGALHEMVVTWSEDGLRVYDPIDGRENKLAYNKDGSDLSGFHDVIICVPKG
jgi:hypothetical protein